MLSLILITFSFRASSTGALHQVESVGVTVLRPFEVAAERVARPFRDVYGYFAGLVHVKRENERLKAQVNELRQTALQGEQARAENARLRDLLRYVDSPRFPEDYRPVNTRISQTPGRRSRRVATRRTLARVGMSRDTARIGRPARWPRDQGMCRPEAARAMTSRWISEVPS